MATNSIDNEIRRKVRRLKFHRAALFQTTQEICAWGFEDDEDQDVLETIGEELYQADESLTNLIERLEELLKSRN